MTEFKREEQYGIVLDDQGSIDVYETYEEALKAGGDYLEIVRITTEVIRTAPTFKNKAQITDAEFNPKFDPEKQLDAIERIIEHSSILEHMHEPKSPRVVTIVRDYGWSAIYDNGKLFVETSTESNLMNFFPDLTAKGSIDRIDHFWTEWHGEHAIEDLSDLDLH